MKSIIQAIELSVINAVSREKVYTFRHLIFMHAEEFISNNIKHRDIKRIAPILGDVPYAYEYSRVINYYKFLKEKNTCSICQKMIDLSHEVWERVKFIRKSSLPLKVNEVTITENLLFELNKSLETCSYREIEIFEAENEKVNGNDIEFFVQQPNGKYIFIPLQAKILYPSHKYMQIPYKDQTDKLIAYAKKTNGFPLYLLYNYYSLDPSLNHFGCSIVDANYIKANFSINNPTFDSLHIAEHVASPWYTLVCNVTANSKKMSKTNQALNSFYDSNLAFYTKDNLYNQENWKKIDLMDNGENQKDELATIEGDYETDFSPKYRVVISDMQVEIDSK